METSKYKTNIKCSGCIAAVTPYLNDVVGENKWQVDLNDPAKILTLTQVADDDDVVKALEKAGYKAERIRSGK